MARETPVFISYARADEPFATELMNRLAKEPDIAPWQDRIRMGPGDFEDQIKKGIDGAEYFVLVMTPGALRSPWVEREWRYARENGHCIVPIKPTFDSPTVDAELDTLRGTLPVWMQKIQTYDFDRYWKRFVAVLQNPCQATRTPFLAANLPANFVQRPAEFRRLVDAVLDATHKNPSGRTVALHGTGGFGKTSLALSVCHDPDVFAACDSGILWVTLGEQPAIVPELEKIYTALTDQRPGFKTQDDAMLAVARKLEGKRCLIVIDDVWKTQHVKPFLQVAASCSRLITTRVFSIAGDVANKADQISVGELKGDEAEQVLGAGVGASDDDRATVRLLADRLKRVPLLLQLANRTLRQQVALGQTAQEALDWALQKYDDLGAVAFDDKNAVDRHDAVGRTVEVSLGCLVDERQRCLELGVLHEDTDVPFTVLRTLWNLKDVQVQDLAQRVHDFGLVELNLPGRSIRLHDYIRQYLERTLPQPARVHGRLADAWNDPRQLPGGYPVQHIAYHLTATLTDPQQLVARVKQLIALLTDSRYSNYQRRHGDATALDRMLSLAIEHTATSVAPAAPGLIAALATLQKSYAAEARDPSRVFAAAVEGRLTDAGVRLTLFEAERPWDTLGRLLIAWLAPPDKAADAHDLVRQLAPLCDKPRLQRMLEWVQVPAGGTPPNLQGLPHPPSLQTISSLLQRAGGAEMIEGLEPLSVEGLISGTDATGFIAEHDGPLLVAFAKLDPLAHTTYLERYIDFHASNKYPYYRNRSLAMLLDPVMDFPDASWVRAMVQRVVTAAIRVAQVDFEEYLPLSILALRARDGDGVATATLEQTRQQLLNEIAALRPNEGQTDSWSSLHRRASTLAEIYALALDRRDQAADLLSLARGLPKGFAGFRALSALMLAQSTGLAAPNDRDARNAALTSATAASHRIQDQRFCLHVTAMVNAMRARWADIPDAELETIVGRFLDNPLADQFCAVHNVLEQFEYRAEDQQRFQALPIEAEVRQAKTLREIAAAFEEDPQALVRVNGWIWPGPDGPLTEPLQKGDEVNIPDPEFIPVLAARFAAEALVAAGLSAERRSMIIQRLVPVALPSATALDTVLGRLMLSTVQRPTEIPAMLTALEVPAAPSAAAGAEPYRLGPA